MSSSKDPTNLELGGNQVLRAAMWVIPAVKEYFTEEEMMSCDMKIGKRVEALLWYCMTSSDLDVKCALVSLCFFLFLCFLFLFCRPCATKTWAKTCSNTCRDSRN